MRWLSYSSFPCSAPSREQAGNIDYMWTVGGGVVRGDIEQKNDEHTNWYFWKQRHAGLVTKNFRGGFAFRKFHIEVLQCVRITRIFLLLRVWKNIFKKHTCNLSFYTSRWMKTHGCSIYKTYVHWYDEFCFASTFFLQLDYLSDYLYIDMKIFNVYIYIHIQKKFAGKSPLSPLSPPANPSQRASG